MSSPTRRRRGKARSAGISERRASNVVEFHEGRHVFVSHMGSGDIAAIWRSAVERSGVEGGTAAREPDGLPERSEHYRRQPVDQIVSGLVEIDGLALNDVASVAGVSRHALRKWRRGEARPERPRMRMLCRLAAFTDHLRAAGAAPAEWLAAELDEPDGRGSGLRVVDVLAVDGFEPALEHFRGLMSDWELLGKVFPGRLGLMGPLQVTWRLEGEGPNANFLVHSDAFGLSAAGATRGDAESAILEQVRDYLDHWFGDLRRSQPHRGRLPLVLAAQQAEDEGRLADELFGA